jgi:hypothetical protein
MNNFQDYSKVELNLDNEKMLINRALEIKNLFEKKLELAKLNIS